MSFYISSKVVSMNTIMMFLVITNRVLKIQIVWIVVRLKDQRQPCASSPSRWSRRSQTALRSFPTPYPISLLIALFNLVVSSPNALISIQRRLLVCYVV